MTELCEVVITAPDPDWLKNFSRKLVEQRLCASAHNFAPVQSVYRWRGDIYERTEGRVSLHTRRDRVAMIVALAKQEHRMTCPASQLALSPTATRTTWRGSLKRPHLSSREAANARVILAVNFTDPAACGPFRRRSVPG
jgi:periplasmic divalent cation tolerance protein